MAPGEPAREPARGPAREPARGPAPAEVPLADELCALAAETTDRGEFLHRALQSLRRSVGCTVAGLVRQASGEWEAESWTGIEGGGGKPLPTELISEAMDQSRSLSDEQWIVAPLTLGDRLTEVIGGVPATGLGVEFSEVASQLLSSAVVMSTARSGKPGATARPSIRLDNVIQQFASTLWIHEVRLQQSRRIEQLKGVLKAAADWQRLDDADELLRAIADTACQLLHCERASIFLWDRRRGKLIGRPALGFDGKPLEVDDDAGVVGEVLQTSEAKFWNVGSDEEQRVNRDVDKTTDFRTESLVAVPMLSRGRRGAAEAQDGDHRSRPTDQRVIGVFECLNRQGGEFEQSDAVVLADLATHAAVAIESLRTRRKLTESRDRLVDDAAMATKLIGNHPAIESIRETSRKVAATDLSVLILGQNGTGKEVLARHIHYESKRRSGPFVAVNCAALVESLLESELFGHEKGAFTDAQQTRAGKFEMASGGTLFLDEVGDMSPGGQAKLLRVLEEKVVVRVGGSQPIPVDVRVLAATNQPLQKLVEQKRFREDLFFRLNVVALTLPPLRDRGDDVLLLTEHFLNDFCYQIGRGVPQLTVAAKQALLSHPWPGNIRELRNTIERVCYLTSGPIVDAPDLMLLDSSFGQGSGAAAGPARGASPTSLADATKEFQQTHIDQVIAVCEGNMTEAANQLGLHRSNLYRKMRQLGMPTSNE